MCGLPGASSVIESVPVREPAALGVNETAIAQVPPEASVEPQLVVVLNSAVPVISEMLSVSAPMLVTDTSFGTVVVDTVCDPKSRLAGKIAMPEAIVDAESAIFPAAHTIAIEILTARAA